MLGILLFSWSRTYSQHFGKLFGYLGSPNFCANDLIGLAIGNGFENVFENVFGNLSELIEVGAIFVVTINLQEMVGPTKYTGLLTCECRYCENMDECSKLLLGPGGGKPR